MKEERALANRVREVYLSPGLPFTNIDFSIIAVWAYLQKHKIEAPKTRSETGQAAKFVASPPSCPCSRSAGRLPLCGLGIARYQGAILSSGPSVSVDTIKKCGGGLVSYTPP